MLAISRAKIASKLAPTLLAVLASLQSAQAHDASTYGGLFRSRDQGESWFSIDTGVFIGGALGIAVHPVDRDHLLMATDAGLLRSHNGGRDWQPEVQTELNGPVFAVAFAASGATAWAATTHNLLWWDAAGGWENAQAPLEALPAQAIIAGQQPGRAYLAGLDSFFVSTDNGRNWSRAARNLPEGEVAALARAVRQPQELLFLVVNAALWLSEDGAQSWRRHGEGLPVGKLETIFVHPRQAHRMHALAQRQLYASDDYGATWRSKGQPLPETHVAVRGLSVSADGKIILVATHKGLFRSSDGAATWALKEGNLPIHLEAGPLSSDPHDDNTYYAGYALTPYGETWRRALDARAQRPRSTSAPNIAWPVWVGMAALIVLSLTAWWLSMRRAREQGTKS